jgi:penicillin amidase
MPGMTLIKVVRGLAVLLLLAALAAGVFYFTFRRVGLPWREGEHKLPGLAAKATVRYDAFGVPHISAESEADLAMALGYVHANDRMTQMELGRRAAQGRLSELMGERTIELDVYFRTLRLGETAAMLERSASEPARRWLEAYAAGVNAWLRERDGGFGPELRLLGADPEPWRPRDSLGFALLMARDLSFWHDYPEEERFNWLRAFGIGGVRELLVAPELASVPAIEEMALAAGKPEGRRITHDAVDLAAPGSNNWVVGKTFTAAGQAMLASDPHLGLRLPSVWYQAQLRAPGYEVAGMSLPGTPGIVIGRGSHIAWAFTNTQLDDQDVFFEQLDESGENVRRGDAFVPILEREETILVKGAAEPKKVFLRSTDYGPLFEADPQRGLPARSLRWTGHFPADPVGALYGLAKATTPEEALAAIEGFVCPAQNLVAAFDDGSLLYTVIGRVPDRKAGDGRLPSPGWDPAYGWKGLRPRATNPRLVRPAEDLIVTANNDIRPPDYPLPLSADFMGPGRADRIRERLLEKKDWRREELAALQVDDKALYARQVIAALGKLGPFTGDAGRAFASLEGWDGRMETSGPAALYILAQRRLIVGFFGDEQAVYGLPGAVGDRATLLALLEGRISESFADDLDTPAVETKGEIAGRELGAAWAEVVARFGEDSGKWDYAGMHRLTLRHPLDAAPVFGPWMRRGPFEVPGSAETVLAFGARWERDGKQAVRYGPSMRWVVDWSEPDQAWSVLPGGQSGHPADPHYDDQIALYLAGELKPAPWSEAAIRQATKSRLELLP